jgi:nucleoside triphosphate pyrophosphatase
VLEGAVCGQPEHESDARARLRALSGREHEVLSAVALIQSPVLSPQSSGERSGVARAVVRFRALSEDEIEQYVATGEWRGRAGGYAIQGYGSTLVDHVDGDLDTVIGLPVTLLAELAPELF